MTDRSNFLASKQGGGLTHPPALFSNNKGINMYYQILSLLLCGMCIMLTGYHFLFDNEWIGLAFISIISLFMVWDSYENGEF